MKKRRRFLMSEKEKKSRNTIYLPEDLIVEILSRVPRTSLARFRSTSKGWNALIEKDERLAKNSSLVVMLIYRKVYLVRLDLHGIQDDNIVKVISQFSLNDPLSTYSLKEVDIHNVFHCDGLLLCTTMDGRLVVWNPCSGETSRIITPLQPYNTSDTYALGKSSCNNEYKILRVHHGHDGRGYGQPCLVRYEIYDFTSISWRVVGETRDWSIPRIWRHGTSVNGNTYWLTYTYSQDSPTGMGNTLRCFDFSTERFGCVSLPSDPLSYNVFALSVTREDQNLCLLTSRDEVHDIDIWMATNIKSTGDMSWTKIIKVERTHPREFLGLRTEMTFLVDRDHKVLLHPTKYKNFSNCLHIVGKDKYIQVDLHDVGSKRSLPVSNDPTLVQIQQGSSGVDKWKAPITKFS